MKTSLIVYLLLKNMGNMHELGRQGAFELGNHFYAQFAEYQGYWRKELPTGEKYFVSLEVITDDKDMPVEVRDTNNLYNSLFFKLMLFSQKGNVNK